MTNQVSKKNKGFTLIELLVVISIIALLSSVILVALKGAKQKSNDAAVTEEINQIRNWFELQRSPDGSYANAFIALGSPTPVGQTSDLINHVDYYSFGTGGNTCSSITDTQLQSLCTAVVKNSPNATIPVLLIGGPQTTWSTHSQYSIQAQIPSTVLSTQLSMCLGSSDNTSSNNNGVGSADYNFGGTGCLANP